jgi:chemotaxis family two-component system sensor kinase Cph1
VADVVQSLGDGWSDELHMDVAPILLPTDRAITVGLVLTELMIHATKYAYGGEPGPLAVTVSEDRATFRLTVADRGVGAPEGSKRGFGSRMMDALVKQLGGELVRENNRPGLRVVLTAPMAAASDEREPPVMAEPKITLVSSRRP